MNKIKNFFEFLNEELVNEDTIEGYQYRFKFEGEEYVIDQGEKDKTIFGIKKKDGSWRVLTKGDMFNSKNYGMTRDEMVKFLQKGIKYFNVRNPVEIDDIRGSEWEKFFEYELKEKPGRLNKKYVILKLHCGKAQCKWHAKHSN